MVMTHAGKSVAEIEETGYTRKFVSKWSERTSPFDNKRPGRPTVVTEGQQ